MIFADTVALRLLGDESDELVGYHRAHGTHVVLAGARCQVVCRSRYTEDALAAAVAAGTRQYVILGAGLDSFAYRPGLSGRVRIACQPLLTDVGKLRRLAVGTPIVVNVSMLIVELLCLHSR